MLNIDFSCNVNPLGPPKRVLERLDLERLLSSYPEYTNREAIRLLSEYYTLPQENLTVGDGSTEFFFAIPEALNMSTGTVIIPTFWEYETSLKRANKKIQYFKTHVEDEFQVNLSKLEELLGTQKTGDFNNAIYICNPNNPTSTLIDSNEIVRLCDEFSETKFIIDETYMLFRRDYDNLSLMREAPKRKNLVVVTSFSKFFTVPGARIGVCYSSKDDIEAITKHQIPYGVNTLAQALIPYLLQDHDFIRESREFMDVERKRVYQMFKESPQLQPYEPQANFMLVRLKDKRFSSVDLISHLKHDRILIRGGTEFSGLGKQYIRFSIRNSGENDMLLRKINDFYKND